MHSFECCKSGRGFSPPFQVEQFIPQIVLQDEAHFLSRPVVRTLFILLPQNIRCQILSNAKRCFEIN